MGVKSWLQLIAPKKNVQRYVQKSSLLLSDTSDETKLMHSSDHDFKIRGAHQIPTRYTSPKTRESAVVVPQAFEEG